MQTRNTIKQSFLLDINTLQNPDLLIQSLKLSFKAQKGFVKEINNTLNYYFENINEETIKNKNEVILVEQLITILPILITQLGIPFTYLLLNEDDIIDNCIELYFNSQKNGKISQIFKACLDIFSFSLYYDYINRLKHFFFENGIIENNEEHVNSSIDSEQYLFEIIIRFLNEWSELSSIGKDIENLNALVKEYNDILNEIKNLPKKMEVSQANIEFYKELIKTFEDYLEYLKIKDGKQNIFDIEENFGNDNDIFNEEEEENILNQQIEKILNTPLHNRTFFYQNEKIKEKPNQEIEFKNYSFPLNQENAEEIKKQFCSFLNTKGGRLYIGINEQNIVKGIILNYKKRDVLRNFLVNLTYDFYPKCRLDKILVYFIPIKDINTQNFIQKKYIIKIRIYPGDPEVLYSMSNKGYHSTVRYNGKCCQLNSTEINNEIIKRDESKYNNKNIINNKENEIKDPEPEVNPQDLENNEMEEDIYEYNNNKYINNGKKNMKVRRARPQRKNYGKPYKINKNFARQKTYSIKVTNIDENIQLNDVNRFFSGCKCCSQKFFPDGYGYLNFSKINDANNCLLKYDSAKLGNKKIKLYFMNND